MDALFDDSPLPDTTNSPSMYRLVFQNCNIQNVNMRTHKGMPQGEAARKRGNALLQFCVELAKMQMDSGRYFVYADDPGRHRD